MRGLRRDESDSEHGTIHRLRGTAGSPLVHTRAARAERQRGRGVCAWPSPSSFVLLAILFVCHVARAK